MCDFELMATSIIMCACESEDDKSNQIDRVV